MRSAILLLIAVVLAGCSAEKPSSQPASADSAASQLQHGMSLAEVESIMGGPGVPVPGQEGVFTFHTADGTVVVQFYQDHFERVVEVKK